MNLGLYRREHLHSGDPNLIGAAIVEQIQRTHGAINAWQAAEHTEDGSHTAIHADSLDVAGTALIHGDLGVDGAANITGGLSVGALSVAGDAVIGGTLQALGALDVAGAATLRGGVTVTGPTALGPTTVTGTLDVTGASTLTGQVTMGASASVAGNLAAGNVVSAVAFIETPRPVPLGYWQDEPYDATAFGASAPLTFQPTAAQIVLNQFTVIGRTLHWKIVISGATVGGSGTGTLSLRLPGGLVSARANASAIAFALASGAFGLYDTSAGGAVVSLLPLPTFAFAPGPVTLWAQFALEIH